MKTESISHHQPPLKLERIIGLNSLNNSSFLTSISGEVFYIAGCFVVRYSSDLNRQKGFYKCSKGISCIAMSNDGKYLAISERSPTPATIIWEVDKYERLVTLLGHKHGVGCQAFSPDGQYLVTVGYRHDKQLILWDWRSSSKLSVQKLGNKVNAISYHNSGGYFVTAGDRHLKWWSIIEVLEGESVSLEGKAASITEDLRNSNFMDVMCGYGSCDQSVFCTSSTGMLLQFNQSKMVEKWVQLECSSSFCMELICQELGMNMTSSESTDALYVGCSNGIIRCFSPLTLQYITTLPSPAPLANNNSTSPHDNTIERGSSLIYPACYGIHKVLPVSSRSPTLKLAAIYADRSLFVWDISEIRAGRVAKHRSFVSHRACIWDVKFIIDSSSNSSIDSIRSSNHPTHQLQVPSLPKGSFVTCSADNSIKFWNIDSKQQRSSRWKSPYAKELLHSIDVSDDISSSETTTNRSLLETSRCTSVTTSLSVTQHLMEQNTTLLNIDISEGVPDAEVPDRPQSKSSPRALAIHPYCHQIACGDKLGRLRVFDLSTMSMRVTTQAHSAEILTLSYSPAVVSRDDGLTWYSTNDALSSRSSSDGTDSDHPPISNGEVVLLASAGRDRLIHLFDASSNKEYAPIATLDQHKASVTIVQFTSDGKRFLSCSGDRTIVFNNVEGRRVSKVKVLPTPHGTINGLAIEASNKFAITSGQDKRLSIWNLQTGKHMRVYKSEHINAELYKSDIDPSGMYIATCAFDRTISIFDFFSGELVAQVSGHSELITGLKFSPDGRLLVSIGGDGCIMVWRVADSLVKAMQDRLVELLSSAQRRNMKAVAAVEKSLKNNWDSMNSTVVHPNNSVEHPNSSVEHPDSSVEAASVVPPNPPTHEEEAAVAAVVTRKKGAYDQAPKNRWLNKADPTQTVGYELFGKKINPIATPEPSRNKFTLELTSPAFIDGITIITPTHTGGTTGTAQSSGIDDDNTVSANSNNAVSANRLARALEATDDVILCGLSDNECIDDDDDDDDDDKQLFKSIIADELQSNEEDDDVDYSRAFDEEEVSSAVEPDLEKTQSSLEGLEKSAYDLEHWLEDMIRSEAKLDDSSISTAVLKSEAPQMISSAGVEVVVAKKKLQRRVVNKLTGEISSSIPKQHVSSDDNPAMIMPVNQSLSSVFFRNLQKEEEGNNRVDRDKVHDRGDDLLPPPPPLNGPMLNGPKEVLLLESEKRQRETAANLAIMRERLRSMGILSQVRQSHQQQDINSNNSNNNADTTEHEHGSNTPSTVSEEDQGEQKTAATTATTGIAAEVVMIRTEESSNHGVSTYALAGPVIVKSRSSSSSSGQMQKGVEIQQGRPSSSNSNSNIKRSVEIALELKQKTEKHHRILRDLEVARMQASDSYRELSELRRSLKDITLDGDSTIAQQSSRGTSSSSSSSSSSIPPTDIDVAQDGDELLCDDSSSSMALLNSSIAEVDRLLHQFQDTLASFSVPSINSTTIYRPGTAASVDNTIEIEMNGFLERYSDKLLDMVLQKLDKSK